MATKSSLKLFHNVCKNVLPELYDACKKGKKLDSRLTGHTSSYKPSKHRSDTFTQTIPIAPVQAPKEDNGQYLENGQYNYLRGCEC